MTIERRNRVLALVRNGVDSVEALGAELGMSGSTIRRDLADLRKQGLIARTYGGAMLAPHPREQSLTERQQENADQKAAIARVASQVVADGDAIYLDGGTTVAAVVPLLVSRGGLRMVTPSLADIDMYSEFEDASVIIIGGELRVTSKSTIGTFAEESLTHMTFDHAFLGADGVDLDFGLCERDLGQTRMKELVMERAKNTHVLIDSSKIGQAPFNAWAPLRGRWEIVTDSGVEEAEFANFRAHAGQRLKIATTTSA